LTHTGVMDALIAAKARGLEVYVLLEHDPYNPGNPNAPLPTNLKAANYLAKGGLTVQWTSKAFKYTHAKGLLIDDATMWLSTANFTKSGLGVNGVGSREYLIADRSPSDVAQFQTMFAADWAGTPFTPTDEDLIISPSNSRAKILGLLRSAKKDVTMAVEVAGDPEFDTVLAEKIKAGVRVRALLAHLGALKRQEPENPVPPPSTVLRSNAEVAKAWKALGAEVKFQQHPHLHAKTLVVDGHAMYVGSVNFTTNSMDNNREFGLLVTTPSIVATVQRTMEQDWVGGLAEPTKK
jgi:phosphatidylserine/phosphatidylglycerophosphate/cardiolipin synthase-like enzyme